MFSENCFLFFFLKNGVRDKANVIYKTPGSFLFGVKKYCNSLLEVCAKRNIQVDLFRSLIHIDAAKKEATFEVVNDENTPKKTEVVNVSV